mmetsp:Transcript_55/g.259  ORF Transcript_55/g.259 Transcript_55/m.259 type:complete len:216 (-) Transcript_55:33-680(-)
MIISIVIMIIIRIVDGGVVPIQGNRTAVLTRGMISRRGGVLSNGNFAKMHVARCWCWCCCGGGLGFLVGDLPNQNTSILLLQVGFGQAEIRTRFGGVGRFFHRHHRGHFAARHCLGASTMHQGEFSKMFGQSLCNAAETLYFIVAVFVFLIIIIIVMDRVLVRIRIPQRRVVMNAHVSLVDFLHCLRLSAFANRETVSKGGKSMITCTFVGAGSC